MENDVPFLWRKLRERHICAHAHFPADIRHQRPHQRIPRRHCALIDRKRFIRHKGRFIHCTHDARAAAGRAGALAVKREALRARRHKYFATDRTDKVLADGHVRRWIQIMSVRTTMAGQPREHQPQAVQELRRRAKSAADSWHRWALSERKRCRHIVDLVKLRRLRDRHAPSGVCRKRFQITPRALGIEHAQRQRRFSTAADASDPHQLSQRNIHIQIFQIVHPRPTHNDVIRRFMFQCHCDASFAPSIVPSPLKCRQAHARIPA